jgi:hypothetical protein
VAAHSIAEIRRFSGCRKTIILSTSCAAPPAVEPSAQHETDAATPQSLWHATRTTHHAATWDATLALYGQPATATVAACNAHPEHAPRNARCNAQHATPMSRSWWRSAGADGVHRATCIASRPPSCRLPSRVYRPPAAASVVRVVRVVTDPATPAPWRGSRDRAALDCLMHSACTR